VPLSNAVVDEHRFTAEDQYTGAAMKGATALIVGAGSGLSTALARAYTLEGMKCVLAARHTDKLKPLCDELGATAIACDSKEPAQVAALFTQLDALCDTPAVVVYNASGRVRGPLAELDPKLVADAIAVSAYGGFLVGQAAAQRMLKKGAGTIIFTGASASVKGYALSAAFAMGKFALRGLAQSMARELAPQNIHVAHVVIDGGIRSAQRPQPPDKPDSFLEPDAIAQTYVALTKQQRSAWTWEIEVRPWVERF
jgi:NAD(P)-dependent dehydrogenase (short-subunit alcohol dehydrogenase family)